MTPPERALESILTVCFFFLPIFAVFMETPLADELAKCYKMLMKVSSKARGKYKVTQVKPDSTTTAASPSYTDVQPLSSE